MLALGFCTHTKMCRHTFVYLCVPSVNMYKHICTCISGSSAPKGVHNHAHRVSTRSMHLLNHSSARPGTGFSFSCAATYKSNANEKSQHK